MSETDPFPRFGAPGEYDHPGESLPGGFTAACAALAQSEAPFVNAPPLDAELDLAARAAAPLVAPAGPPEPADFSDFAARARNLAREMAAENPDARQLHHDLACCIMRLRRRAPDPAAYPLFHRIWRDEGARLSQELPIRWQVSSAQVFADHGTGVEERMLGAEIALLFGLVKLHESERRFSGLPAWQIHPAAKPHPGPLPLGLSAFAIEGGDLARNLLARIWRRAEAAEPSPVAALARQLLRSLEASDRTVFRRLARMRQGKSGKAPGK
ncbi:hypothetical protein [Phaeovulum sp. W22_SRMD_FR3]|uniref:hypothetical protein n=1 Tax=Phaeovulum sp. W22_SRMD_FR3 TaxID=3240274 RepID=UPI003F9EB375